MTHIRDILLRGGILPSVTIRAMDPNGGRELNVRPTSDGRLYIGAVEKENEKAPITVVPLHLTKQETRAVAQEIARAEMAASDLWPHKGMNAREQMNAALDMLNFTDETLSFGLRSPEDAIRLWRAWSRHAEDSFPDQWEPSERIEVLGYDPMSDELPAEHRASAEVE